MALNLKALKSCQIAYALYYVWIQLFLYEGPKILIHHALFKMPMSHAFFKMPMFHILLKCLCFTCNSYYIRGS